MSEWNLSGVKFEGDKTEQVPLTGLNVTKQHETKTAIFAAFRSNLADPQQSKYIVGGSIGYFGEQKLPAGNTEYGLATADHMEQRAKTTHEFNQGRIGFDKPAVMAIVVGSEGGYAGSCGNCRDVLRDTPGAIEHLTMVDAFREGGSAIVFSFKDLLVDSYPQKAKVTQDEETAINKAIKETAHPRTSFDVYGKSPLVARRTYALQINTDEGDHTWGPNTDHAFHTTTAAEVAQIMMRQDGNPFFHRAVFVGAETDGSPPDVLYRDRQTLSTMNLDQELLIGQEFNPDILLATYDKNKNISTVWETRLKDMLPLPFTPRNFGPEFMEYLKNEVRKYYEP